LLLNKNQQKIFNAISKDSSRPIITNVVCRKGLLIGADGFLCVGVPASLEDNDNITTQEVWLRPEFISKVKGYREPIRIIRNPEGDFMVSGTEHNKEPRMYYEKRMIPGNYPSFENIIPSREKKAWFALDSGLLKKFLSAIPDKSILCFGVASDNLEVEPIEIVIPGAEIRGMIMSMRVPEPTWMEDDPRWMPKGINVEDIPYPYLPVKLSKEV
jgi:hypothetical protein